MTLSRLAAVLFAAHLLCGFGHGGAPGQTAKSTTDYSIACNGTADDTANWANLVADNQGGNVVLTIPRGSVCCFLGSPAPLSAGIANLRVLGYGATITNFCNGTYGQPYFLGGDGIVQDNTHSALAQTTPAGASFVTLVTAGQTSRFTTGQWAALTGGDRQGFGYPPNPYVFDFVLITAKDGGCQGSGTVCFHDPLQNAYKSTWPAFDSVNLWAGGPSTLYALPASWGNVVEWRGVTFTLKDPNSPHNDIGINCNGRICRFADAIFTGSGNACTQPSQNMSFVFQNVTGTSCGIEADKIVGQFLVERSNFSEIDFQSASVNQVILTQTPLTHLACTPLTAVLSFSNIGFLQKGGCGYGPAQSVILNSMSWTTIQDVNTGQASVNGLFTMSGGVMSQTLVAGQPPIWAIPGGSYIFTDGVHSDVPVTVNDLATSGGNLQIITNQVGGYPFTPLDIKSVPVPTTTTP